MNYDSKDGPTAVCEFTRQTRQAKEKKKVVVSCLLRPTRSNFPPLNKGHYCLKFQHDKYLTNIFHSLSSSL